MVVGAYHCRGYGEFQHVLAMGFEGYLLLSDVHVIPSLFDEFDFYGLVCGIGDFLVDLQQLVHVHELHVDQLVVY